MGDGGSQCLGEVSGLCGAGQECGDASSLSTWEPVYISSKDAQAAAMGFSGNSSGREPELSGGERTQGSTSCYSWVSGTCEAKGAGWRRPPPPRPPHSSPGTPGVLGGIGATSWGHLLLSKTLLLGQELDTHVQSCVPFGLSFLIYKMGILIVPPH